MFEAGKFPNPAYIYVHMLVKQQDVQPAGISASLWRKFNQSDKRLLLKLPAFKAKRVNINAETASILSHHDDAHPL